MVSIASPLDGSSFDEGVTVSMQGRVIDDAYSSALDSLAATWAVDGARVCDGAVFDAGGTTTCDHIFTAGEATITLTATDPEGQAATATSNVLVNVNIAPSAEIVEPLTTGIYYSDHPVVFAGVVSDGEDSADQLTVTFESSLDGTLEIDPTPTSGGDVSGSTLLTEGAHFITMTVTDTTGRTGEDTVAIEVNGPNNTPDCGITSPASGYAIGTGETILFEGFATDPDVAANLLSVTWTSDKDGTFGTSTPSSSGDFFLGYSELSTNTHTVTLQVSDDVGALCTDAVLIQVGNGPEVTLDAPVTGDTFSQDERINFSATVSDAEDNPTALTFTWESDVDGVFSTQGANSAGLSAFTYDELSPGTHTITVTATDTDGFTSLDRATISVNGLPSAPGVSISPDPATSGDALVATVTAASVDPEGDPITYRYAWYQNGLLTAYTSNTIDPSVHARGENWEVRVYPNDGFGDGPYGSDVVTLGNGVPTMSSVSITPGTAYTDDTLTAVVSGWSDPDGDPEGHRYQWTKNGSAIGGATDATLPGSFFVRGDVLTVTVTPYDGYDTGAPVTSGERTISNALPTAPVVAIYPELPEDEDTFACNLSSGSSDADGDAISYTYSWTRNGSPTAIVSSTVDASYTSNGDTWVCSLTPSDGTDVGPPGTDTVTVGDRTAPGAPNLTSLTAYRNEDWATVSGRAEASSTVTLYIVGPSGTTTTTTGATGAGTFSVNVTGLTRGGAYTFYATATDASGNTSGASNTVGTEVCDPYDDFDLSGTTGDTCTDAAVDWSNLPDDGSRVINIVGNILDGGDSDWYLVQTSDNLTAGINYYRFRVQMTHGAGDYVFVVHDGGCDAAYLDCSTAGYTEYESFANDSNDSGHGTPADGRYCNYGSWPYYNNCDDLSSDYYIEVFRTGSSYDCEYYELEISNGIW